MTKDERRYQLDRRISIGVIVTLVLHAAAGVWFAAVLSSQVGNNGKRIESLEAAMKNAGADRDLLIRLDERMRIIAEDISELKRDIAKEHKP